MNLGEKFGELKNHRDVKIEIEANSQRSLLALEKFEHANILDIEFIGFQ